MNPRVLAGGGGAVLATAGTVATLTIDRVVVAARLRGGRAPVNRSLGRAGMVFILSAVVALPVGTTVLAFTGTPTLAAGGGGVAGGGFADRFNRARYDAQREAALLSDRLRHEVGLESLADELGRTIDRVVQPASVSVMLVKRAAVP